MARVSPYLLACGWVDRQLYAEQLLFEFGIAVDGVEEGYGAEPVGEVFILAEQAGAQDLARGDGAGGLLAGQEGGHRRRLGLLVPVQAAAEAVEDGAAEREGLPLVDHRHEEDDDDGPRRVCLHLHVGEEGLVGAVASDHLAHRADGLGVCGARAENIRL